MCFATDDWSDDLSQACLQMSRVLIGSSVSGLPKVLKMMPGTCDDARCLCAVVFQIFGMCHTCVGCVGWLQVFRVRSLVRCQMFGLTSSVCVLRCFEGCL